MADVLRLRPRLRLRRGVDGERGSGRLPERRPARRGEAEGRDRDPLVRGDDDGPGRGEGGLDGRERLPPPDHGLARPLALPPRRGTRRRRLLAEARPFGRHRGGSAARARVWLAIDLFEELPFEAAPLDARRTLSGGRRRHRRGAPPRHGGAARVRRGRPVTRREGGADARSAPATATPPAVRPNRSHCVDTIKPSRAQHRFRRCPHDPRRVIGSSPCGASVTVSDTVTSCPSAAVRARGRALGAALVEDHPRAGGTSSSRGRVPGPRARPRSASHRRQNRAVLEHVALVEAVDLRARPASTPPGRGTSAARSSRSARRAAARRGGVDDVVEAVVPQPPTRSSAGHSCSPSGRCRGGAPRQLLEPLLGLLERLVVLGRHPRRGELGRERLELGPHEEGLA